MTPGELLRMAQGPDSYKAEAAITAALARAHAEGKAEGRRERDEDFREAIPLYTGTPNGACRQCWEGHHDKCTNPDKPMLPASNEQIWRGGAYGGYTGHLCPCRFGHCEIAALRSLIPAGPEEWK